MSKELYRAGLPLRAAIRFEPPAFNQYIDESLAVHNYKNTYVCLPGCFGAAGFAGEKPIDHVADGDLPRLFGFGFGFV